MRIGITGASGFIGSALMRRHLAAADDVRCLTRRAGAKWHPGITVVEGDLARPDDRLERFADGLDVLYHCAGELTDESRMRPVNVGGTRALLEAAAGRVGRWVQLSSAGVYGRHRTGVITEDTPLNPDGAYERTKADADALVVESHLNQRIGSCVVLRPSIVFGPGMPNQSIAQMARMIERRLFFFIGDRGASANYVHVLNVIDALVLCAANAEADGRIYNLSDWCTIEEFVAAIADGLGCPQPQLRLPESMVRWGVWAAGRFANAPLTPSRVDALVNRSRYAITRIQQELGFWPGVSIPAGLERMVAMSATSGRRVAA